MAIGTTAAIIGSAAIGAGSSALASRNASKAQQQSANATQQAADAATAEQRRQFDTARADNAPWLQTGTAALSRLSGLYGLAGGGAPTNGAGSMDFSAYLAANPDVAQAIQQGGFGGPGDMQAAAQRHYNEYGRNEGRGGVTSGGMPAQQATTTQPGALEQFFTSPDYQFRQSEQMRALTARNAALGIQDSGAAQRSALQLSGNLASGEFNNYANRLSALAGVGQTAAAQNAQLGQSYASNVGNIAQNQAQNLASSYQNKANIQNQGYGNIAGIGVGLLNNFAQTRPGSYIPRDLAGLY